MEREDFRRYHADECNKDFDRHGVNVRSRLERTKVMPIDRFI